MTRFACIAALFIGFVTPECALAQWQFSGGAGLRQVRMTESDQNGRTLVQEQGWLPGIELRAEYLMPDWRIGLRGESYRHQITYDGRLQGGAPFSSDTDTAQSRIGIELARQLSDATRLIGAIEWDRWQRDIRGRGTILGIDERYTSWRLLAGAEARVLQAAWGQLNVKALLVRAAPEQLRVRFENRLFDDANLSTRPATGLQLAVNMQPAKVPNMTVTTDFDWLRIARSDDAVLRKGGVPVGVVAQSEHMRRAFGIRINYRF